MAEEQVEVGTPEPAAPPPPMNERPVDGPGSGRSALRQQLEKSVDSVRKTQEPPKEPPKGRGKYVSTARQEGVAADTGIEEPAETEAGAEAPAEAPAASQHKVPDAWSKEAKAMWEELPPAIQAAVAKREVDSAKGVEDLKKKYAELDQALQPRMDMIRRFNTTPGVAVHQLFSWFEALSANPQVAFPALAKSFNFDLRAIPGLIPPQGPAQTQQAAPSAQTAPLASTADGQPAGEIPPTMQQYFDGLLQQKLEALQGNFSQQLGQLTNAFQAQSQAKTEEILANWAKDKPYFEEARKTMAYLIQSQAVPPLPNGAADLDRAYDMASWSLPEIREKILADKQKQAQEAAKAKQMAEKKAQQEQADKARRAQAGSISSSAPGEPGLPPAKKKGKTVAESLREAINELRE